MTSARSLLLLPLLILGGCEAAEAPKAQPGAVERTADALDRNEAAERNATIRRLEREAQIRAADSEERIKDIERRQEKGD
jgi:hypothetical protein